MSFANDEELKHSMRKAVAKQSQLFEDVPMIYTVRLLSFMTGIVKSSYVKEMRLLLFSFLHRSLVTVHTDLHGHTASGCLFISRPLQWCLMYLSWLSGCPKSSQRGAPSSGISLFGTKSNQQVLNLANTEDGRAQSLFVGPKTA